MSLLILFSGTTGGTVNYSLACDAGAYVLSCQAATLTRGYSLACDAGAYTLTGQNATLVYGHQLALDAGAYSLAGQDAILTRGYQLACNAGAYVLTGKDATLTYSPGGAPVNYTLTCDAGAYVLTGQDTDLVYTSRATGGGAWPIFKLRNYHDEDEEEKKKEELLQQTITVPVPHKKTVRHMTMEQIIGKTAAAEMSYFDLEQQIQAIRRKKCQQIDDEEMMMF